MRKDGEPGGGGGASAAPVAMTRLAASQQQGAELASRIIDPWRVRPIVGIAKHAGVTRPLIDSAAIAAACGPGVEVWEVHAGLDVLAQRLPPGLKLRSGAVRVWWGQARCTFSDPGAHPFWEVHEPAHAADAARHVTEAVIAHLQQFRRAGVVSTGEVVRIRKVGVDVVLETGEQVFASNRHLTPGRLEVSPWNLVAVGQRVRVQLASGKPKPGNESLLGSLRACAPDPWMVVERRFQPGDHIEGIVTEVDHYRALVDILPGARAMLVAGDVADHFVSDVAEHVEVGLRLTARLVSIDRSQRHARLSLRHLHDHVPVQRPPASLPGGPAWLEDEQERTIVVLRRRLAELEQRLDPLHVVPPATVLNSADFSLPRAANKGGAGVSLGRGEQSRPGP